MIKRLLLATCLLCGIADGSETVRDGNFSDACTWDSPPKKDGTAIIRHAVTGNSGECGRVDVAPEGALTITGRLDLYGSLVVYGKLEGSTGELRFHVADDKLFVGNTSPGPDPINPDFHPDDIGLWGMPGSEVHLGGEPVTSWLNAVPQPNGATSTIPNGGISRTAIANGTATLQAEPIGWRAGDKLVLTSLDGKYAVAVLQSVNGSTVTFDGAFSAAAIECEGRTVYPKIGNLTRRLVVSSDGVVAGDTSHRAHVALMHGGCAQLDYVEFRDLGPRGKLGRYPVHYHKMGDSPCCRVNGCSVWQTVSDPGNRFISVHDSSSITVTNNVCLRSRGHGYFSETGNEANNTWTDNLSVGVDGREELSVTSAVNKFGNPNPPSGSATTAHYWLYSGSTVERNVAIGGNAEYGLIVLPTKIKPAPKTANRYPGIECYGINGWSYWFGISDVELASPISAFAKVTSTNKPIAFMPPATFGLPVNLRLTDPTLIYNGTAPNADPDFSYVSNLFVNNQKGLVVTDGLIVGKIGVAMHYTSDINFARTKFRCDMLLDPTYWQFSGTMSDCDMKIGQRLFKGTYPILAPTGILTIQGSSGSVSGKSVNGRFTHKNNTAAGSGVPEETGSLRLND